MRHFELLNIPDFVVFVGPNGIGKTAIFQAIGLLKDWVASYTNSRGWSSTYVNIACDQAEIVARFELTPQEWREVEQRNLHSTEFTENGLLEAHLVLRENSEPIASAHPALPFLFSHYKPSSGIGVIEHFSSYRYPTLGNSGRFEVSFNLDERHRQHEGHTVFSGHSFAEFPRQLATVMIDDLLHFRETGENRDSLSEIKNLFNRMFAPKQISGYKIDKSMGIQLQVSTPDGVHYLGGLSSGESEIFQVFASFTLMPPRSSIIMYDTPEAHLHGSIERQIADELQRLVAIGSTNQVFIATHSYEIINASPLESIFKIDYFKGQNQITRVADERDRIEVYKNLGASIAVQLSFSKVFFVEGASDESMIGKLIPDLPASIKLIPSEGVTNVMEAAGFSSALLEQTRYSQFFAIRDRDHLTNEQRSEKMQKYPQLIILDRYHIENYLLHFGAIARVMNMLGYSSYNEPSIVENEIQEIARGLIDNASADYVRYQLNYILGGIHIKSSGTDPVSLLKVTSGKAIEVIQEKLNETTIDRMLNERKEYILQNWAEKVWLFEFSGREILNRFVGRSAHGIEPSRFINLLATEIGRSVTPEENELRKVLGVALQ